MLRLLRSVHIEISLPKKSLDFYQGGTMVSSYPIAIGKSSTPSPIGHWKIINKKILNYPSVFGSRWMGISLPSYGIHGTNNPNSIGKAISLGCIRMFNNHAEELFSRVSIGTPVLIYDTNKRLAMKKKIIIPEDDFYIVQKGDNLFSISTKLDIPMHHLVKANLSININKLKAGQKINIPKRDLN